MIVLKYSKTESACFISHIDLLRHVSRILRRAGISVNYSQGFNPHALVYFSPPLGVGIASSCEYLAIDTDMDGEEALKRYNASVPPTLRASEAFTCDKNPNLQGKTVCADYVFDAPYKALSGGFEITYQKKGQTIKEDVSDKVYAVFDEGGKLALRLASGNTNLRPDRLLARLNEELSLRLCVTDIRKIRQFVEIDGALCDVDDYLKMKF
ncbi:MAG: TIGR03936 family radical SAM-associated protein [Bacteroides sp.]|nr:TIGR03936 family radical SAM-associated protein [Bacillota bacterium]MCM1393583.1 TIGR03936 family radical SAM-associated protein [[Eubacterium] siraeum]MCM1454998.1 TIGR03936 family radical SAM-associated protein [Bacteroides sp.]